MTITILFLILSGIGMFLFFLGLALNQKECGIQIAAVGIVIYFAALCIGIVNAIISSIIKMLC